MKIAITPVSLWTSSGFVAATHFEVRAITYAPPSHLERTTAGNAECYLLDGSGRMLVSKLVTFTDAQAAAWGDDANFLREIARSTGLTPI